MDEVQVSVEGDTAFVRLQRAPTMRNALNGQAFDALRRAALRLSDAPPAFVVLTGEGGHFCTGLDLGPEDALRQAMEPASRSRDAHRAQELVTRQRGAIDALGRLPCPVVAAIEGDCHGAGLELALIADLRVVSSDATFRIGDAGVLTGLGGLVRAVSLLGLGRATELALCGVEIGAAEALRLGLVNRVVPAGRAVSAALDLIAELKRTPAVVRVQTLLALRAIQHKLIQDLFDTESQAAARTWIAKDWQAGPQPVMARGEPGTE